MPAKFSIDQLKGVVFSTYVGVVTMEESLAHYQALKSHPDFRPELDHLSDARSVTMAVSSEDIRKLAKINLFRPDSRRAIVVTDDAVYGVSRMYQAQVENSGTVGVFRDLREALAWLGLPPDTVLPGDTESSVA